MAAQVFAQPAGQPHRDFQRFAGAEQFADHIRSLVTSPETANRIGKAARRLAADKYDWRVCLGGLERFYCALLGNKAA